ncbi:MAG: hypothetical protein NC933_03930, partial [Candidatus Omnitrophica bacterium]|nr:hypothetical protein [Candidatus Omnitrophota bacterium]
MLMVLLSSVLSEARASARQEQSVSESTNFSILEAREKGMFNMGPAMGDVVAEREEAAKKEVLKFDYTIFPGAIVGVWTNTYPSRFGPDAVDAVRVGVKPASTEQLKQIAVKLEIKGNDAMQTIPLTLREDWNYAEEAVEWGRIGKLREVVFVISPLDTKKKLDGIIYFDLNFYRMTPIQKYVTYIKIGVCVVVAAAAWLFVYLLGLLTGAGRRLQCDKKIIDEIAKISSSENSLLSRLRRDLLYGILTVSILGTSIYIYILGLKSPLNSGINFGFVMVAFMGLFIAELAKFGLSGRHITPSEAFESVLLSGLLAASSTNQAVLQAPASWMQALMFSNWVAAITFAAYHVANLRSIASSGRRLKSVSGSLIVAAPYIFNWLCVLESAALLQLLGNIVTFHLLSCLPIVSEVLGRIVVMFVFNEIVMNAISAVTKARILREPKAHLFIFLVSISVVISPVVATFGSTEAVSKLPLILQAIVGILASMLSFAGLWGEVYLVTGGLLDGGHHIAPSPESIAKHVNAGMKKGMAYSGILMGILYALYLILKSPLVNKIVGYLPMVIGTICGALIFPFLKTIIETFDGSLRFFERMRYSYRDKSLFLRGAIAGAGFTYALIGGLVNWPMPNRILFGCVIGILSSGGASFIRDAVWAAQQKGRIQTWRLYFVDSCLGAFVGSAVAFYLDTRQVPVIIEKFNLYVTSGYAPQEYIKQWGDVRVYEEITSDGKLKTVVDTVPNGAR